MVKPEYAQVAVITGAASGIGFALAKAYARRNTHVLMVDKAKDQLHTQVKKLQTLSLAEILAVECDVTQPEEINGVAALAYTHFGRVDLLFNNAGICGPVAPLWEIDPQSIRDVFEVNLFGVINGLKAFLPKMFTQNHRAHVVNVSSFYGLCSGSQLSAYAMSKHAIVALSESIYFDIKRLKKPVDVSVVCSSFINTQLVANSEQVQQNKLHDVLKSLIKRGRSADDVAEEIISAIARKNFYILPDKEIKYDCQQRIKAVIEETEPYSHSLEKILSSLSERVDKNELSLEVS